MTCDRTCCRERLSEYVDGELNSTEDRDLKAHLVHCEDCRRELEQLAQLSIDLSGWEVGVPRDRSVDSAAREVRKIVDSRSPPEVWDFPGSIASLVALVNRFWSARVTVPVPALVIGISTLLILTLHQGHNPGRVRETRVVHYASEPSKPGRRPDSFAIMEEWPNRQALWGAVDEPDQTVNEPLSEPDEPSTASSLARSCGKGEVSSQTERRKRRVVYDESTEI